MTDDRILDLAEEHGFVPRLTHFDYCKSITEEGQRLLAFAQALHGTHYGYILVDHSGRPCTAPLGQDGLAQAIRLKEEWNSRVGEDSAPYEVRELRSIQVQL